MAVTVVVAVPVAMLKLNKRRNVWKCYGQEKEDEQLNKSVRKCISYGSAVDCSTRAGLELWSTRVGTDLGAIGDLQMRVRIGRGLDGDELRRQLS